MEISGSTKPLRFFPCFILLSFCFLTIRSFPLSDDVSADQANFVVVGGRQDKLNGKPEARNIDAIVWCRPDALPNLREEGFCSARDDLDNLCNFLEVSESVKTCGDFEGKYCCYRSIPNGNSFEEPIVETPAPSNNNENTLNEVTSERRASVRPSVETIECRPDAIPNLQEAGFCASVDEIDPLCWLLEINEAVNTCATFKGNHCCYRSLEQGNTLAEPVSSSSSGVGTVAKPFVIPQRILLVPTQEVSANLVSQAVTTTPEATTEVRTVEPTTNSPSTTETTQTAKEIISTAVTTTTGEMSVGSTTAMSLQTAPLTETTVVMASSQRTEEPFVAVAEDKPTRTESTVVADATTSASTSSTMGMTSSRPSSRRRRFM